MQTYTAHAEDTLTAIGQRYDIGYIEMIAANPGIDPWLPGEGAAITIPSRHIVPVGPHEGIVINLATIRLFYYATPEGTPETHAIGVGRDGYMTPVGSTTVVRKADHPSWYRTAGERADKPEIPAVVPPGPDNPLGAYALYLGWPGYLIHGTDDERSVGRLASRGCIRMYAAGIQQMFEKVPIGTKVTVVTEGTQFATIDGQLNVSIFPSPEQADELEDHNSMIPAVPDGYTKKVLAAAGNDAGRLNWDLVRAAAVERKGYPVAIMEGTAKGDVILNAVKDPSQQPVSDSSLHSE